MSSGTSIEEGRLKPAPADRPQPGAVSEALHPWQFFVLAGLGCASAARLMRQLDAGAGYREQIERDLERRLADVPGPRDPSYNRATCASCSTVNDPDARFCKNCGSKL